MTAEDLDTLRRLIREELAARPPANAADPLECFTPSEAAARLKLSDDTVRAYCAKGKIRAKKFGRDWRIKRADLEEFIEHAELGEDVPDPREVGLSIAHSKR